MINTTELMDQERLLERLGEALLDLSEPDLAAFLELRREDVAERRASLRDQQKELVRLQEEVTLAEDLLALKRKWARLWQQSHSEHFNGDIDVLAETDDGWIAFEAKRMSAPEVVKTVMTTYGSVPEWRADDVQRAAENLRIQTPENLHAIRVALSRLERRGELRRLRHGVYALPAVRSEGKASTAGSLRTPD